MSHVFAYFMIIALSVLPIKIFAADSCDDLESLSNQLNDLKDLSKVSSNCIKNSNEGGECTTSELAIVRAHEQKVISINAKMNSLKSCSYIECLDALNGKSLIFSGRIKPISKYGGVFAVDNYLDSGSTMIFTPDGAFGINSKKDPKCKQSIDISSTSRGVVSLMTAALAVGNDPENSEVNKKQILQTCLKNPQISALWNASANRSGRPVPDGSH